MGFIQLPWAPLPQGAGVSLMAEHACPGLLFPRAGVSNTASQGAAWWDQQGLAKLQLSLLTCKKYGPWGWILPCWFCAAGAQSSSPSSSNPPGLQNSSGVATQGFGVAICNRWNMEQPQGCSALLNHPQQPSGACARPGDVQRFGFGWS